jgi:hypothetical protein
MTKKLSKYVPAFLMFLAGTVFAALAHTFVPVFMFGVLAGFIALMADDELHWAVRVFYAIIAVALLAITLKAFVIGTAGFALANGLLSASVAGVALTRGKWS